MAPKRHVTVLRRVGCEWASYTLNFEALPLEWSSFEASQRPEPWLNGQPNLHALRRMPILADASAVRLLLALKGNDRIKEEQILGRARQDDAADRAINAARSALAYLIVNPPKPRETLPKSPTDFDSTEDDS